MAHEALIRNWPRFRAWIDADRGGLQIHRRVSGLSQEWASSDKNPAYLFVGAHLAEALDWAEAHSDALNSQEMEFLAASREAEERGRTHVRYLDVRAQAARRRVYAALVASGVALVLTVAAAVLSRRQAEVLAVALENERTFRKDIEAARKAAEGRASIAPSLKLAALSRGEQDRRLDRALLLGVEALRAADIFEARSTLFQALNARPGFNGFLHASNGAVAAVAFSPDGRSLATGLNGERVKGVLLWDVATRRQLGLPLAAEGLVSSVAFSLDGKTLAAGYTDPVNGSGGVVLWDAASRGRLGNEPLKMGEGGVRSVAFSPDDKTLAAGYADPIDATGGVVLWDAASRRRSGDMPLGMAEGGVRSVAFSPDSRTLAAGYENPGGHRAASCSGMRRAGSGWATSR